MYSVIESKFAEAVKKGSLHFTQPKQIPGKSNSLDLLFSLVPQLQIKPGGKPDLNKQSPWSPPEEDLWVEKLPEYNVVLNKYAVSKYHFLLVTKEFASQSSPLSGNDWTAAIDLLRQANKESGKKHIGFFNAGPNSGASIAHKHIQFLTAPDNFQLWPDTTPGLDVKKVKSDSRVPFAHYLLALDDSATGEDIALVFTDLLGQIITKCAENSTPVSYNIVFTDKWVLATPRSSDATEDGISINSLGTVGLLLAKSEEQLKVLEEKGFDIVKDLGFEYEDVREFDMNLTGYTQY